MDGWMDGWMEVPAAEALQTPRAQVEMSLMKKNGRPPRPDMTDDTSEAPNTVGSPTRFYNRASWFGFDTKR